MLIKFLTSLAIVVFVAALSAPALAGGKGDDRMDSNYGKEHGPAIVVDDTLNGSLNDNSTHTKTDTTTTTTTKTKTTDNSDHSFDLKVKDTPIAVDNQDSAVAQDGSDANIKSHNDYSQTTHIKDSFKFFDERCQNCTNVTATMTQTTGGKIYYDLSGTGGIATSNSFSGAKAKGGDADATVTSGDGGNAKANGGNSGDAYANGQGGKAYSKGEGGNASADGGSSGDVTANTKAGGSLGGNAKAIDKDKDSGHAKVDGKGHHERQDSKLSSGKDQAAAWGGDAKGGHADGSDATTGDAVGGTAKSKGEGDEALAYGKGGKADTGDADGGNATAGNAKGGKAIAGDASGNAFAKASGKAEANGHGGKLVLTNKSIMENAVRNNAGITNVANGSGSFNNVGNMSTVSFSLNTGTIK